ncbi:MAG: DUF2793 domain-containing protein [Hyphomicrobiaceae bacterium]|nr:DUF2793 domain-containing protein [Hyphomicrobiaceae bacterium]
MDNTPRLTLPYLAAAQSQKHVTHNEALQTLDTIVQLTVVDRDLTDPPASPAPGDVYIVASPSGGGWAGRELEIAAWLDGAWRFITPLEGWRAWIVDEQTLAIFSGGTWNTFSGSSSDELQNMSLIGIRATADTTNRLAVSASATLFNHDGDDHRVKINKAIPAATASILYQTGFGGRAEIGLTGDDNFHFKTSSDGSTFKEAILIDAATGLVTMPSSNYLAQAAFNLLQDSGRFGGAASGIGIGTFSKPSYIQEFNSSTFAHYAKFINNNTDYGGTAGTLNADVRLLIDKIRNSSYRRNSLEFNVARLTKGSGTSFATTVSGATYHLSLAFAQVARLAVATVHFYAKAKTGNLLLRSFPGQRYYIDDVLQPEGNLVLTPAEGWRSIRISDQVDPYSSWGYTPSHLNAYQESAGDEALICCLAMMPGLTRVDPNIGVIPSLTQWS